jgi:hypothetical protein
MGLLFDSFRRITTLMYQGETDDVLRVREVEATKPDQPGFGSGCMLVCRCHMHQQRCRSQMHSSQQIVCFLSQ